MTGWVEHALWWHVYPLGFVGAEAESTGGQVVHRLPRVTAWLDYAVELGASGLMLGPVFASGSHGYDTVDHFRIDPRLGDDSDFDVLLAAARERGMRVLLDGVFNHVGRGFPAFQQVLDEGPTANTASWFRLNWPSHWQSGDQPEYDTFEGHRMLVALAHEEPAVVDYTVDVMNHWLARGIDGWRLDAAYAVPPSFWAQVVSRVRPAHPDCYLVGEVIHGDYVGFVGGTGIDAVTQYELWKAIWSSINDANWFELAWALDRHNEMLEKFVPLTFVGNHDVTRLASRLGNERHLPHALVVLLSVGGTPSIYAGDEQAFRGIKEDRMGGDAAVRPAFPPGPPDLAPYGWPVYRLHQDLIGLRRRNPWLRRARTRMIHLANKHAVYEVRNGEQRLLVALNLYDAPVALPAPGADSVLLGEAELHSDASGLVTLPEHGWAVLGAR